MKSTLNSLVLSSLLIAGSIIGSAAMAQESAQFILDGKITLSGNKAESVKVLVYQDNKQITSITTTKNSFDLELPFDESYTLKVSKSGYVTYTAYIDAQVGDDFKGKRKLSMNIDLPVEGPDESEYFSDFPDSIIRYNERLKEFIFSDHYSAHISEKKVPLQANAEE